jgi:hypothetical protein
MAVDQSSTCADIATLADNQLAQLDAAVFRVEIVSPQLRVPTSNQSMIADLDSARAIKKMPARDLGAFPDPKSGDAAIASDEMVQIKELSIPADMNRLQIPEQISMPNPGIASKENRLRTDNRAPDLHVFLDLPSQDVPEYEPLGIRRQQCAENLNQNLSGLFNPSH